MLAIDARLLLNELLEDATQILNLQQCLLVLDIASNRKRVRINHQLVQLLLQVDLVLQLLMRLHRQRLLLLAALLLLVRDGGGVWSRALRRVHTGGALAAAGLDLVLALGD